jgi:hypothetical protein
MSNVIDFLEQVGRNAQLCYGSQAEVQVALENAGIAEAFQAAILAKDQARLEGLLGQVPLCAVYMPGKEEEEDESEETPSREPEESLRLSEHHAVAA